jgi:energy-coupling factor transporter ATP-binding protein EcfA2
MSYQVLARKWRPKDFGTLVGQEHVVRALRHALEQKRLHHAYLFTGTRGVGKTTLARILAKCLNCETGITAQPCNRCSTCTQIDAGRFPDYVELDAASNRGVDEMTQLLERSVYAPAGRFKVRHRRGAPALGARLQRHAEDAGGAAGAPQVHPRDDRSAEDPGHGAQPRLQFNLKQMPRRPSAPISRIAQGGRSSAKARHSR